VVEAARALRWGEELQETVAAAAAADMLREALGSFLALPSLLRDAVEKRAAWQMAVSGAATAATARTATAGPGLAAEIAARDATNVAAADAAERAHRTLLQAVGTYRIVSGITAAEGVIGLVSSPAPGWPNPRAEACWLRPDLAVGLSSVNHCLDEYSSSSVVKSRVKVVSYR
jgi:hypothetical protein